MPCCLDKLKLAKLIFKKRLKRYTVTIHGSNDETIVAISVFIGQDNDCGLDPLELGETTKQSLMG